MNGQPTIAEMIEACRKVGTPQHVAALQASILGQELGEVIQAQGEKFQKL